MTALLLAALHAAQAPVLKLLRCLYVTLYNGKLLRENDFA